MLKRSALTIGITSLLALPSLQAHAGFLDFTVDETPYGGTQLTVDKFNGGYSEKLTFDGNGGFQTTGFATLGQLFSNDGTDDRSDDSVLGDSYMIYAIFKSEGTISPVTSDITQFNATGGSVELYLDRNNDTLGSLGATALDNVSLSNDSDDFLLASTFQLGTGTGLLTSAGGFFDLVFENVVLSDENNGGKGADYFLKPDPFYIRVNVDGDFDNFDPTGTQTVTGDVSAVFVPEPGSLAVLGVAALGLGLRSRRKTSEA
ncbi:PEP-CTERM domain protein [Hahella sp. CCB-MM4]|uniref:flocculation-associated PEP-CTERM protein PepA n=1 Tax=Hahella sp. (strain CCB-MM4) TaxID=1926491 RepID=UPI000B9B6BD4|nr:flocculation-associated PEP-CTERM protein PepA [Hahella sp. CCB-MM4]OZG75076.1 PEP-CTERM domain protein [Hahella sp. CCB-MM4]